MHELGTIVGVWAHPDDESYLAGALMALARDTGNRVVSVCATSGEHGTDDPSLWPPVRLGAQRRRELRAALAVLGVEEVAFLGYEDGTLADVDGTARLASVLDDVQPDTILTFGPDGMTGHPDHVAVSRWVDEVASGARVLHASKTASFSQRFATLHYRFRLFDGPPPVADPLRVEHHLVLDGDLLDRKVRALYEHASQTLPLAEVLGADVYRAWVDEEVFVTAPSPAAMRSSMGAGDDRRSRR